MRAFISMTRMKICDVNVQAILKFVEISGGTDLRGHIIFQFLTGGGPETFDRALRDKGGNLQVRAKAIRKYVDKMIQLAKEGSLHSRRQVRTRD